MLRTINLFFIIFLIGCTETPQANDIQYQLSVSIQPQQQLLSGQAIIKSSRAVSVELHSMQAVKVNNIEHVSNQLKILPNKEYRISYQLKLNSRLHYSDAETISLNASWYPHIDKLINYQFSARLPASFQAISEADIIEKTAIDESTIDYNFKFDYPLDQLTLVASTKYQLSSRKVNDIHLETWFFAEHADLAEQYLDKAEQLLVLYEKLLSPYPYKRFAMVESPFPNGLSMPTYTLLGRQIIKLPFILSTSLGHEFLHQWFGNSVYIDYDHGNWSEGLTNYLADHLFAEQKGEGSSYRKTTLRNYMSYVNDANAFPARKFISRHNKATSSIGYGKIAMIFHQIRDISGDEAFFAALKQFIDQNQFRRASWHELQKAFESVSNESLYEDFNNFLTRDDLADIKVSKAAEIYLKNARVWLDFELQQDKPYHLHIPLQITYDQSHSETISIHFTQAKQNFHIALKEIPDQITIDPDYHLMRYLHPQEREADLAQIMGKEKLIVIVPDTEKKKYQPLIQALNKQNIQYVNENELSYQQLNDNSLIIAGKQNALIKNLFGKNAPIADDQTDVSVAIKKNPYNNEETIALIHAQDDRSIQAILRKISHYGQYNQLWFKDEQILNKKLFAAQQGILLYQHHPSRAVKPDQAYSIEQIVEAVKDKKVIFIGEQHDQYSHHYNQWLIIKKLHQLGKKVAIGMEMFQRPYQSIIDDYLQNRISEAQFLEKTQYFNRWRYDYSLYKPIIDYAKQNKLPLIALNLDTEITRQVSQNGIHSLTDEQKKQLPINIDLSNAAYQQHLESIFTMHQNMKKPSQRNFDYFMQSQILWDETMAENASEFINKNPDYTMVILAGNGHIKNQYGIPQRINSLDEEQIMTIIQDDSVADNVADFVLYSSPLSAIGTPKIGAFLDTKTAGKVMIEKIVDDSVAQKSGLKKDDQIIKLDNKPIETFSDLKLALVYADTSLPVTIEVLRDKKLVKNKLDFNSQALNPHH